MISIIAAVGKNLEIGKDGNLLWSIPNDLKYFQKLTTGKTIVMGRKTYESIGKPLPNRKNIVLTRKNIKINDVEVVNNKKKILNIKEEVFIIGGESIYKKFLPYASNIYLTEIEDEKDADTYFPEFNKDLYNKETIKKERYKNLYYSFVVYRKK